MRKLCLVAAFLLAGCATRPSVTPPTPRPQPPAAAVPAPAMAAADYFRVSASRSLLLVRAGELVAARDPVLAEDAQRVAAAHRGVAMQLNLAGRRLNLLPPAELLPFDQAQFEALSNSPDLSAAWRQMVGLALSRCDSHEADYARRGASPTLRPVARFALGVCREELARLR